MYQDIKNKEKSFLIKYPLLLKEWHPTKNGNIKAEDLTYGSHKKIWWRCNKCGEDWNPYLYNRTIYNKGCPYCSGRKVGQKNSLAFLYPEISKEWHPTKNGDLKPNNVTSQSNKIAWWKCKDCSKSYKKYIYNRTSHNQGCPDCARNRLRIVTPHEKDTLESKFPDLAKEWDYIANGKLLPSNVSYRSRKKVGWICPKCNHRWSCRIRDRVNRGTKCEKCSDRITSKEIPSKNCLAIKEPEIAKEWHPTRNGDATPWDFFTSSSHRAWWQCKDWAATIASRTKSKTGAYHNSKTCEKKSLGFLYPHLEKQWDYTKNKITPFEITPYTPKKYRWICKKGHKWPASPARRTKGKDKTQEGTGCPYCSGRLATEENNLAVKFPELTNELHPTKNGAINPYKICPRSNKYYFWYCRKGHEWRDTVNHRTSGRGCKNCYSQTSGSELRIYTELLSVFDKVEHRHKLFHMECDVYLPIYNLAIEYDGYPWHKDKDYVDRNKTTNLINNGIELIRIRDDRLEKLESDDLLIPNEIKDISIIKDILKLIRKKIKLNKVDIMKISNYLSKSSFQNESLYTYYMRQRKMAVKGRSFADKFPEVAKYWDYDKNYPLNPEDVTPYTHRKAYFKCDNGHSVLAFIFNKSKGSGCKECNNERRKSN